MVASSCGLRDEAIIYGSFACVVCVRKSRDRPSSEIFTAGPKYPQDLGRYVRETPLDYFAELSQLFQRQQRTPSSHQIEFSLSYYLQYLARAPREASAMDGFLISFSGMH
jgi:hypothetical protein